MNHIHNKIIFKIIANRMFLFRPDLSIVITEIIIPTVKTIGESINVKSMRFSERIKKLILMLIKDITTRLIKTNVKT